jgi:nitrogen fixation/metabolism regulation signal transduction histidine kinase
MELSDDYKPLDKEAMHTLKHDVKNQLSNINLAVEQLRYELENPTADFIFYMDTIAASCNAINNMIKNIG